MRAARFWFSQRRKPVEPFAFFSYGMTRCGSTLAFQIARVALIQAGYPQPLVAFPDRVAQRKINFISVFDDARVAVLREFLDRLGHPVAIKTHSRPDPPLARLVETGEARAHAVFRDPRDMALSLLDSGARARRQGRPAFSEMATLDDARRGIDNQMDSLSAWLQLPGVQRLSYDSLAFDTRRAAGEVLEHLGIDGSPARIARQVLKREFTQRAKAVPNRHETEMSEQESNAFLSSYEAFFDLVMNQPHDPRQLPPGTVLGGARHRLSTP